MEGIMLSRGKGNRVDKGGGKLHHDMAVSYYGEVK